MTQPQNNGKSRCGMHRSSCIPTSESLSPEYQVLISGNSPNPWTTGKKVRVGRVTCYKETHIYQPLWNTLFFQKSLNLTKKHLAKNQWLVTHFQEKLIGAPVLIAKYKYLDGSRSKTKWSVCIPHYFQNKYTRSVINPNAPSAGIKRQLVNRNGHGRGKMARPGCIKPYHRWKR